jgi:hypothetical protein
MEIDHIVPKSEGGSETKDNAIPVCFECHAEIHSYNDKHPRGRKFRPDELRHHRENWIQICKEKPDLIIKASRDSDVGPIQSLLDELEFNIEVSKNIDFKDIGCPFREDEFDRANREGSISLLQEDLKNVVLQAYIAIGRVNHALQLLSNQTAGTSNYNNALKTVRENLNGVSDKCDEAKSQLLAFLVKD